MFEGEPLWFPSDELLTSVLHAEISAMMHLLAKYPDLRNQFDIPDATVLQRNSCFALVAHRKVISTILDTLAGRYIQPSLSDEESEELRLTYTLVADDAPTWALEMRAVIEGLPARIYASLPEPLRRGGYNPHDPEQMEAMESAKKTLSTVEQIQASTQSVIDQQLRRLQRRWSPTQSGPKKPKHWLKGTQGLTRKANLPQYKQGLTERQELAFSLKWEYGLGLTEIASRMGIDRKTAHEHIEAAKKKMEEALSNEKSAVNRAKRGLDF